MKRYVTDLNSLENAHWHINACVPKSPHLAIEIGKALHCLLIHCKDDVAGLDACFLSRALRCDSNDEETLFCLFCEQTQPGSGGSTGSACSHEVAENRFQEIDRNKHVTGNETESWDHNLGEKRPDTQKLAVASDQCGSTEIRMRWGRKYGVFEKILPITCKFPSGKDLGALHCIRSSVTRHENRFTLLKVRRLSQFYGRHIEGLLCPQKSEAGVMVVTDKGCIDEFAIWPSDLDGLGFQDEIADCENVALRIDDHAIPFAFGSE